MSPQLTKLQLMVSPSICLSHEKSSFSLKFSYNIPIFLISEDRFSIILKMVEYPFTYSKDMLKNLDIYVSVNFPFIVYTVD